MAHHRPSRTGVFQQQMRHVARGVWWGIFPIWLDRPLVFCGPLRLGWGICPKRRASFGVTSVTDGSAVPLPLRASLGSTVTPVTGLGDTSVSGRKSLPATLAADSREGVAKHDAPCPALTCPATPGRAAPGPALPSRRLELRQQPREATRVRYQRPTESHPGGGGVNGGGDIHSPMATRLTGLEFGRTMQVWVMTQAAVAVDVFPPLGGPWSGTAGQARQGWSSSGRRGRSSGRPFCLPVANH